MYYRMLLNHLYTNKQAKRRNSYYSALCMQLTVGKQFTRGQFILGQFTRVGWDGDALAFNINLLKATWAGIHNGDLSFALT